MGNFCSLKRAQKGRETCPFCALNGLNEIRLTALEGMAGTTRLELATPAVTVLKTRGTDGAGEGKRIDECGWSP
jgi:hypothetical protein